MQIVHKEFLYFEQFEIVLIYVFIENLAIPVHN